MAFVRNEGGLQWKEGPNCLAPFLSACVRGSVDVFSPE
jgi:hypothetical protein